MNYERSTRDCRRKASMEVLVETSLKISKIYFGYGEEASFFEGRRANRTG
jgi:hypothetical protein